MERITGLCLLILLRNSICSSLDGGTRNSCIKPDDELEDGASTVGNREAFNGVSLQDVVGNGDMLDVLLITAVENGDEVEGNSLSSVDITSSVLPTSCKSASGTMSLYK